MNKNYDFVVIGGGSAGYAAAATATKAGLTVALIEGGRCVNRRPVHSHGMHAKQSGD